MKTFWQNCKVYKKKIEECDKIKVGDNMINVYEVVDKRLVKANEITVKVEAQDRVSGMPENAQYNYYIKTSEEETYRLIAENQTSDSVYCFWSTTSPPQLFWT